MNIGLNTNVKHLGRIFHIQTEDSGKNYGHVISHLFDDGTILATEKTEYGELLESDMSDEQVDEEVKKIMRRSHRLMIQKLITGGYDGLDGIDGKKKKRKKRVKRKVKRPVAPTPVERAAPSKPKELPSTEETLPLEEASQPLHENADAPGAEPEESGAAAEESTVVELVLGEEDVEFIEEEDETALSGEVELVAPVPSVPDPFQVFDLFQAFIPPEKKRAPDVAKTIGKLLAGDLGAE